MLTLERHAFRQFENELKELLATLDQMGETVREQLVVLKHALGDASQLKEARQKDREINELEFAIEKLVTDILSKYNPTGDELRFVLTSLKISTALELMGDMAKNAVKHATKLESLPQSAASGLMEVVDAARVATAHMLIHIEQFKEQAALELFAAAQMVDDAAKKLAVTLGGEKELKGEVKRQLLIVTKNLERIGDLATDIVKYCHYIHTGRKYEKPQN